MFFKKYTIPFFVFITGASVLIIEILAIRILAPYFGNTIFAVSSVISVVLAALSLGYYTGGKLADKNPEEELFYGIIALSGACIILLHLLGLFLLPIFGYNFSITQGPIISSVILFFLQSFLLGMLSPFAIKLQTMRFGGAGIGTVSGEIFFWSTLGSIFGSLSAGFLLIPHFGINKIILTVGSLLIILGLFSIFKINVWYKLTLMAVSFIFALFITNYFLFFINALYLKLGVYSRDGTYQKITIYNAQYENKPARFLSLDRDSSAAEFINSDELVYEYTKYYILYQIFNPNITQALMIGGGGYSVPKALLSDLPNVNIDVAEIEPALFDLAKKYFNVSNDPRLHNFVEDGRRLLYDSNKKYDYIFSDAYSSLYSTPSHLTTLEFFKMAKNKLNDNGIFIANVIGNLSPKKTSLALSEIKTFKTVFTNSHFFAVNSPKSQDFQNIIFVGYNSDSVIDFNSANWRTEIKGNKNPIISGLTEKEINVDAFDFSKYSILTDDFAPMEYLTAKEL